MLSERTGFFVLLFCVAASAAFAHLEAGEHETIGNYVADFGYSPGNVTEGQRVIIAFNLLNATTRDLIVPDSVWVRISSGNDIFFAGTLYPESSHVVFDYQFVGSGKYVVDAQFRLGDEKLRSDFDMEVSKKSDNRNVVFAAVSIIVAVILLVAYKKLKKKQYKKSV